MNVEQFLEKKLQKFSILDFSLIKCVYLLISWMIFALYPALSELHWWFYLVLAILCALPLKIHLYSQPGNLIEKMHGYLKTNSPATQVLLFLSMFFVALMLGVLVPALVSFAWYYYLVLAILFAIKPLTVSWIW